MMNNKLENYISTLNQYAEFADKIGDFKTADECYKLLKEAENYNNSNIRTAMERTAFLKKIFRGIKNLGKGIDRFVRKNLGGWSTIAMIAAAPYLSKLAPQLKGIGKQVVDAVKGGKNPLELLKSKNPLVAQLAGDFLKNMQQQAGQQGGYAAPSPTYADQAAVGMQAGMSPNMQQYLGTMGFQSSYQPQFQTETLIYQAYNNAYNQLKTANPQTANNIIQKYKSDMQGLLNQEIQRSKTVSPNAQPPTAESLMIPSYTGMLKRDFPQFSNIL